MVVMAMTTEATLRISRVEVHVGQSTDTVLARAGAGILRSNDRSAAPAREP